MLMDTMVPARGLPICWNFNVKFKSLCMVLSVWLTDLLGNLLYPLRF
jgi:hypothetical protein